MILTRFPVAFALMMQGRKMKRSSSVLIANCGSLPACPDLQHGSGNKTKDVGH